MVGVLDGYPRAAVSVRRRSALLSDTLGRSRPTTVPASLVDERPRLRDPVVGGKGCTTNQLSGLLDADHGGTVSCPTARLCSAAAGGVRYARSGWRCGERSRSVAVERLRRRNRERRRPFGLYAVLVLLFLQGPSLIAGGHQVRDGLVELLPAGQDPDQAVLVLDTPVFLIVLVLLVGLWRLKRWAWVGTMIFVGIGLSVGIIQYLRGQPLYGTMLLNVGIVFYLNQRAAQDRFARRQAGSAAGRAPPEPPVDLRSAA
jgi:hypothetical protein